MKRYIIVKYAKTNFSNGKAPIWHSVFGTYSAVQCDIIKEVYYHFVDAQTDLDKLNNFNPSVGYGIVELEGEIA